MGKLSERIRRLEASNLRDPNELWDEETQRRWERRVDQWPEVLLRRYVEGRLDELATQRDIRMILVNLERSGHAIQYNDHWHLLYRVDDENLTAAVLDRLNAFDVEVPACA